jgi:toxin FitB
MKWLLDTNVVSESVRPRPSMTVLGWIARQSPEQLAISIVTIAELRAGIEIAAEKRRDELTQWFDATVVPTFGKQTLELTTGVLVNWVQLSRKLAAKQITREAADLLIAATARVHDLIVVSRNRRDFDGTGVIVYDPWTGETHKMDEP